MPSTSLSRARSVAILAACALPFLPPSPTAAHAPYVDWTDAVHVAGDGALLQKTSGCDGCIDAGATSMQALTSGDGFIEFAVGEANTFWLAGLSHGNDGTGYADIDFAFRFNGGGWADVMENGVYQSGGDAPYAAGDVFRIAVVGGRVQYSRNGILLRESANTPQYPLSIDLALGSVGATVLEAVLAVSPPPPPGGGFLEISGSPALRPRLTPAAIEAILPPGGAKGAFTFPAPYNTEAVRLTDAGDCDAGQDCLWDTGYSYWRNTNNHVGSAHMYIFLGMDRSRGGAGPTLIEYDKAADEVQNLGPLFGANSAYSYATGEGWYFSGTQPYKLYTHLIGGTQLRRYDILARQFDPVPAFDLSDCPMPDVCPAGSAFIVQPHSSDDDLVHSATVQTTDWQRVGCVVYESATDEFEYYGSPAGSWLDECHVDKSGGWLVLLDTRSDGSRQNRIVNLADSTITTIDGVDGALGHLDMGFGYAVGADTYSATPNATILLKFPVAGTERPVGPAVHFNKRWDLAAANHVAHGNAVAGAAAEQHYACGSNAGRVADMADEIVCFPLDANRNANGSLDVLVVAPAMSDLDAAGGQDLDGNDYGQLPKGNLDVTGRYFIWTTNVGGNRLEAFLVKIPAERFEAP